MSAQQIKKPLVGRAKVKAVQNAPTIGAVAGVQPWERQDSETEVSWEGFVIYRDLGSGKRSLVEVARALGKTPQPVEVQAKKWRWLERAIAWDREVDRERREAELEEVRAMKRRHIQLGLLKQQLGSSALSKMLKTEKASAETPTIDGDFAAKLVDEGVKLERINRGEPETIQQTNIVPDAAATENAVRQVLHDYSKLTKDELRALKQLVGKAR